MNYIAVQFYAVSYVTNIFCKAAALLNISEASKLTYYRGFVYIFVKVYIAHIPQYWVENRGHGKLYSSSTALEHVTVHYHHHHSDYDETHKTVHDHHEEHWDPIAGKK